MQTHCLKQSNPGSNCKTIQFSGAHFELFTKDARILPEPTQGYRYVAGDITRGKYKFGGMTRGLLGMAAGQGHNPPTYELTIWYTPTEKEPEPDILLPRVATLLGRMAEAKQVRSLHNDDGEYTWYKLSEWMQVEIMEIFAAYMHHEPWFRFPFMDMLAMYWRVLFRSSSIVQDKFGFKTAFFSMAFMTDLIPGVFMAIFFAQLQLLAMPLKAYMGVESYDEVRDKLVEQVVIRCANTEPEWKKIDPRIQDVVMVLPQLYTAIIPTFKPFTEVLLKMARNRDIQILQISNQDQVQVRVEIRDPSQLRDLENKNGCKVMFEYQFPVDGSGEQPATTVSLCVEIPFLMDLIRFCQTSGIAVMQVYDWYC